MLVRIFRALAFSWLLGVVGLAHESGKYCQIWEKPGRQSTGQGWTTGHKKLLFYPVRFADSPGPTVSRETAETTLQQTAESLQRMAYGKLTFEWVITSELTLDNNASFYRNSGFGTLMTDIRATAARAGFRYEEFNLDLAQCPQIETWPSGQANLGQSGAVVHDARAALWIHELGHNLGLFHANSWDNLRPLMDPRMSPPFPSNIHLYGEDLVFDSASVIGSGDVRTPGRSVEYGDVFDQMGGGFGDFNASFKARLGWLEPRQVQTVTTSGVYRVYAYDQGSIEEGRVYGLRIGKVVEGRGQNFPFRYWISYRSARPENIEVPHGVEIHLLDQGENYTSQLLDTRPFSSLQSWDAPLNLGKTLRDEETDVAVTALRPGTSDRALWIDVQVQFGLEHLGFKPQLTLQKSKEPAQGETIALSARIEGFDAVSWFWDFGDGTYESEGQSVLKSWKAARDYVVRCEATDAHGTILAAQLPVNVGSALDHSIEGRVTNTQGEGIAGVLVHNGRIGEFGTQPDFTMGYTDSQGYYVLPSQSSGKYNIGTRVHGARVISGPGTVVVANGDIENADFVVELLPEVQVQLSAETVLEGVSVQIRFIRSGETTADLPVRFVVNGNAAPGQDYRPFDSLLVTIPKGSASTSVEFVTLEDLDEDANEMVTISVLPVTEWTRTVISREEITEVRYFYPGWEPRSIDGGESWFQTEPSFLRTKNSEKTLTIADTTTPGLQRVNALTEIGIATERPRVVGMVRIQRVGNTSSPLNVNVRFEGQAKNGIDFEMIPQTVVIPAGANELPLNITPLSDEVLEGAEDVRLLIVASEDYSFQGEQPSPITILEDEFNSEPNSLGFATQWGGGIVLQVRGESGKSYVVEESFDLSRWVPISTNEIVSSPISVSIPPFLETRKFYRSRVR